MAKVRVRERDRDVELENAYEVVRYHKQKFIERQMTGKVVIHAKDREWEQGRQGNVKYYLNSYAFSDHALTHWRVFQHTIRKHSGSHRHQGGVVILCLEGKGYSIVEGVRHDWEAGDLLLLPLKPDGVEHQHFNAEEGKPCKWMAFIYQPYFDEMLAYEIIQGQVSPDYSPK